jgi:hypothetical protein
VLSFANWSERRRVAAVLVAAAGYAAIASVIARDVESGQTTPAMTAAFALGVASLVATGALALFAVRRASSA